MQNAELPGTSWETSAAATEVKPTRNGGLPESPNPKKRGRVYAWLAILVILGITAFSVMEYLTGSQAESTKADWDKGSSSVPVTTTSARSGDIGVYVEALGTVTPVYTVSVVSRVQGEIMEVDYQEGQMVRKGDHLLVIDPRPYEAALTQIQGQLAHDQAVLKEAQIDLDRYQAAFAKNAIAKQQVDDQEQTVFQDEGTVKNDEGQLANAQVNLVYCHIDSPIDGRVGLRLVDPGNLVQANSTTPLVVVTQLQPITVIFNVAEDYLPEIEQQLRAGERLRVDAYDRTQEKKIAEGYLLTLDNQVDTTTGTVKLRAQFPNPDSALFPNQFVNARLLVETQRNVTLLPTATIQRNAQNAFVYIVSPDPKSSDSDLKASVRNIKVTTTDGDTAAVDGVQPGEIAVMTGFDKLQDGQAVSVQSGPGAASNAAGNNPPNGGSGNGKKHGAAGQ